MSIASELQEYLNNSYDYFAQKFCNINEHKFEIKQEVIGISGLFIAKKRYGMKIINDNGVEVNKMLVKGIDTVRSNFPPACGKLFKEVLDDVLANVPKEKIDERILNFKSSMNTMPIDAISMPTGVKSLKKYVERKNKIKSLLLSNQVLYTLSRLLIIMIYYYILRFLSNIYI